MLKYSLIPLLCMIAVVAVGVAGKPGKKSRKDLKLIGGDPVVNDEYSFIASIRIMPRELHRCGGFLISAEHVMTTASCIFSARGRELHAYLNPLRLDNLGVYYPVKAVTTHPNFTLSPQEHDIAVATLTKSVKLLPRSMPTIPDWVEVPLKIEVLSFGWGYDKADNEMGVGNFTLHRYKLQIMSNGLCTLILREYLRCEDLCAATQGLEKFATGPGDVGTPLIYRNPETDKVYAVGILVKETEDMVNAAPYMKLRNYYDWVNELLSKVPSTVVITTEGGSEEAAQPVPTTTTTTTTTESIIITVGTETDEDYEGDDKGSAETRMNKFGSRRNRNEPSATGVRRQLRSGPKPRNSSY